MTVKAKFLIDRYVVENSYHDDLYEQLKLLGFEVVCDGYTYFTQEPATKHFGDDDCVVLYGSMSFVEQFGRGRGFIPGAYYTKSRYLCSQYMHRLPEGIMANDDYLMLPFGEFVRRHKSIYQLFNSNKIFIRPNSGHKTFTGLPIHIEEFTHEINTLRKLLNVSDDTLILIASCKEIMAEYRFFVVGGKVITGSRYKLGNELSIEPIIDEACLEVAKRVAEHAWQVDLAYACDVGIVDGKPKVIELNAFSTSGLYAVDIPSLFTAVAEIAVAEWNDEVSLTD
jgi:hypothetical protein